MKASNLSKKHVSLLLVAAMLVSLFAGIFASNNGKPTFTDVPKSHWAYSYVEQAVQEGWVGGYGDGRFGPSDPVTYSQLATMFVNAFYEDELAAYNGATTPWYAPYCNVIDQLEGFKDTAVEGKAQDEAALSQSMSRFELAHMLYNVLKAKDALMPIDIQKTKAETADWDSIPVDHWVVVAVCKESGIMAGVDDKGTFSGDTLMDRAQACTILCKLNAYIEEHATDNPEPEKPVDPEKPAGTRSPFAFQDGENVQQMMNRLNGEAPAYTEGYLTNGKPITEANIKEMLSDAEDNIPAYTPWSDDLSYDYSTKVYAEAGFYMMGGCGSFAAGLSDYIFGKDAPSTMHQNFDQLKVGDIVWMEDSSTGYNHIVLVTDVDRLAEGFFTHCSGNVNNVVRWGIGERFDRWSETKLAETYVFSRY